MNIQQMNLNLQRVEAELRATRTAFIATRSLLLAALEQLQQKGQFDPKALVLPEGSLNSRTLANWLERMKEPQTPAN